MIIHVRIDERLIHGQVATMWINDVKASRVMVVDDKAAKDDVIKMSLKLATPEGIKLSILPTERAIRNILNGNYDDQKVFIVAKRPATILKLVNGGVDIKHINVGNMSHSEGKTKITNTVSVTDEEANDFRELNKHGIKITYQLVPAHPVEDFMELLNKNAK